MFQVFQRGTRGVHISKETLHPVTINSSIGCPLYPGLLFLYPTRCDSLGSCSWLKKGWEDKARGRKWCVIETLVWSGIRKFQDIYSHSSASENSRPASDDGTSHHYRPRAIKQASVPRLTVTPSRRGKARNNRAENVKRCV